MDGMPNLQDLLDRLPPFIQKGNKYCKLHICKERDRYVMKYSSASKDLFGQDTDLAVLAARMLQKLEELDGTKGYHVDWDFWR